MTKKKKVLTAGAAFAVAAAALTPVASVDAAQKRVIELAPMTFTGGEVKLPAKVGSSKITWYKSGIDMKKVNTWQTIKGYAGTKKVPTTIKIKIANYVVGFQQSVAPQEVEVDGKLVLPAKLKANFAVGAYFVDVKWEDAKTDKAGDYEVKGTYTRDGKTITVVAKYKVVEGKVAFSEVKHEVKGDMLSVSADVKNLKEGEKVELVIFPGKDESKPLAPITAEIKDGKVMVSAKEIPAGTHSFILRSGDVKTAAMEFKVEDQTPMVKEVKALNLKQVVVTFNKDVDAATAGIANNYTFASGSGVSVSAAEVNGKSVTLTVSGASQQQTADLTVEGVKVANGTVIAKATKSVKFVDTIAPTVESVDSIGPKMIKVKFSEPLSSPPTFSLNDGTIAIVSTSFTQGSTEATLTLGTAPASGTYKLKVKDGLDYAGFKIDEVVKEFTFAVDTVAPVLTVKSASPTQIVLTSNEEFTGVTDSNVEFFHTYNGVVAYKAASKSVNGKEITLTFNNPLPEGAFKLFVNYADDKGTQIADLWGNKVAEQTLTGTVVSDTTAPTVTKVEADANTAIKVTFSEAVSGATTASNYEIKDASGNVVAINGSISNVTGNTYSIPVAALNGGSYTLTIKNIKDTSINQNKLADYSTTVSVKDVVAPTVSDLDSVTSGTQAQLLSPKKVKIVFSEAMDKASIENKLNYLFAGNALDSKVTVTAVDNNKAVVLDFTDVVSGVQTTPDGKTLQVLRVADAAGNPIVAPSTDVLVPASVTAPLFDKAEVTGKNTIKLYFKELITSAQATDFLVSNDNGTNYSAAGSISNEVVDGKSVITLTTSQDLPTTAANVLVKTAGTVSAKNGFGTAVSLTATSAADKYAPVATGATAVDNDGDTFVDRFTVQFSEALYVASVQESDFTIEGYEVTGVSSVSGNTVTLTVKEKTTNDLAATPKVTLVGTVEDAARNARTGQDALTAVAAQVGFDAATVATAKGALSPTVTNATAATSTVALPSSQSGATVTWASSVANTISNGVFTTPARGAQQQAITLTATITKGSTTDTKVFTVTVGNNVDTDSDSVYDNATTIQ